MEHEIKMFSPSGQNGSVSLYAGIDLSYLDLASDPLSLQHEAWAHIMQINYCKAGQVVWETRNGGSVF